MSLRGGLDAWRKVDTIKDYITRMEKFLTRHVLEARGLALGDERAHFIAALNRALPSVA